MIVIDPKYGDPDVDTMMFLRRFDEKPGSSVLEVGCNEEYSANVLADNGFRVTGIDLRDSGMLIPPNYVRFKGDFCRDLAYSMLWEHNHRRGFDAIYSTSAVEHFGLGTYGEEVRDPDYDCRAMDAMYDLLRPGGRCYVTVPYGKAFVVNAPHWWVYDKDALCERIVRRFEVVEKVFFKSADCAGVPDEALIVREEDANGYDGSQLPHLTVLVVMWKSK